jgi:hypothetical protein
MQEAKIYHSMVKEKVKLPLCLTNYALCHEDVWGSGCTDPLFLTLTLVGGELSASRSTHFTPWGKSPQYPLDRRLGGLQCWSGRCRDKKILYPTGTQTPTPRLSGPYPVAIPAPRFTVMLLPNLYKTMTSAFEFITQLEFPWNTTNKQTIHVLCWIWGSKTGGYKEFPLPRCNTV